MRRLLQVEDTFQIDGMGLVVVPELALPKGFRSFSDTVTVVPPGSEPFQAIAEFSLVHTRPDGYKILLMFRSIAKELLPIGSTILATEAAHEKLTVVGA